MNMPVLPPVETPPRAVVTDWLIGLIQSKLPEDKKCGDGLPESPSGVELTWPYHVVYGVPGGSMSGPPLGQAQGDARFLFQVDSVGKTRAQAEMAADRVRNWVVGRTAGGQFVVQAADPDGVRIHDRIVDGTPGAPLREGQPPNEVFTVSDTIGVDVSVI